MSEGYRGFETKIASGVSGAVEPALASVNDTDARERAEKDARLLQERMASSPEGWDAIKEIQGEKREFVRTYHEWRKKFWGTDTAIGPDARERIASFENQDGALPLRFVDGGFETTLEGGKKIRLTKGQVFAAREWGIWWKMEGTIDNEQQIALMSHQVRGVLSDRFDDQIVEFGMANSRNSEGKRAMYKRIQEDRAKSVLEMPPGKLVERMLVSALTKAMHDRPDLKFHIEVPSVFKDVEETVDFVVVIESGVRGVIVDATETNADPQDDQRIGIQFTTSKRADIQMHKEMQVEERNRRLTEESDIDELVLVTLPIERAQSYAQEWSRTSSGREKRKSQLDPRGPDFHWPKALLEKVISELVIKVIERTKKKQAA